MEELVEQKTAALSAEIGQRKLAYDKLTRAVADLERSNNELEQFAYVSSHDLQEPLRMVTSYVQLLQRRYQGQLDADADEFIAFAVDGAKRMQRLINDLLAFSRVGTRGRELVAVSSDTALAQGLNGLELLIEDNHARITYDLLPLVMGDREQLAQLFQNLVSNAVKFHSEAAPEVHISAIRVAASDPEARPMWQFSVRDNGIGIDAQYFERIFVIFQRLHSKEEYAGTGIGLAVCKKIVERHGGRIWVESQLGQGATFFFTWPAIVTDDEEIAGTTRGEVAI
jgi:light-regulated signal transduction histidine kinase (bacteriophytochrome)